MNERFKKIAYNSTGIEFLVNSDQGFYNHHTECIDYDVFSVICDLIVFMEGKWNDIDILSTEKNISDITNKEVYNFLANIKSQMDDWNNEDDSFSINDCIIIYHDELFHESVLIDRSEISDEFEHIEKILEELKSLNKIEEMK